LGEIPEEVVAGGVDDGCAVAILDGEVEEVGVVVDEDGGDGCSPRGSGSCAAT
jgi:hypothetical protein